MGKDCCDEKSNACGDKKCCNNDQSGKECCQKKSCDNKKCGAGCGCGCQSGPRGHCGRGVMRCCQVAKVTREAPDFKAQAVMPDGSFAEVSLSQYRGKYVVLYFYPLAFTFVCPSEIIAFDRMVKDLEAKNVQLLGCSVDSHFCNWAWTQKSRDQGGLGKLSHPIVSDLTKCISRSYGVLMDDNSVALRGLFLIDKEGVLRHMVVNDLPLGRSGEEMMRMIDALQFFEQNGEVCPANWKKGAKGMKPSHEGVAEYVGKM